MDLEFVFNRSKVDYMSVCDSHGSVIDYFPKEDRKKADADISKGSTFFIDMSNDYLENVLGKDTVKSIYIKSDDTNIVFSKSKKGLIYSFYCKKEISINIIELIISKND